LGNSNNPSETNWSLQHNQILPSQIRIEVIEYTLLWDLSGQADSFDLITLEFNAPWFVDYKKNRTYVAGLSDFVLSDALG